MSSLPPREAVLTGRTIRLEPLSIDALREITPALRVPEVFASGFGRGPAAMPDSDEGLVSYLADYLPWGRGGRSYVIRTVDGEAVGITSLYDDDPARESVAIGYTAYVPAVWGTSVNPEAKRALLAEVFERGYQRVIFHVDGANDHSRAAVTKLGGHLDGVLRRDRQRADGAWHDTAVFSILASEWPGVRARLDARLAAPASEAPSE